MPRGWRAQETPKFRGAVPGSLEAAALETISVKLHDQIYPISVADTFDPHLRKAGKKKDDFRNWVPAPDRATMPDSVILAIRVDGEWNHYELERGGTRPISWKSRVIVAALTVPAAYKTAVFL